MSNEFVCLPEWVIEDICDFYTFITTRKPTIFENKPRNEFMTFSMVILSNPSYIKNPYLKSKLVEVCCFITLILDFFSFHATSLETAKWRNSRSLRYSVHYPPFCKISFDSFYFTILCRR